MKTGRVLGYAACYGLRGEVVPYVGDGDDVKGIKASTAISWQSILNKDGLSLIFWEVRELLSQIGMVSVEMDDALQPDIREIVERVPLARRPVSGDELEGGIDDLATSLIRGGNRIGHGQFLWKKVKGSAPLTAVRLWSEPKNRPETRPTFTRAALGKPCSKEALFFPVVLSGVSSGGK